jgi:hypothetical protein
MGWLVVTSGAGVVCILASLIGLGMASAAKGHWGVAMTCLGAFALIVFLLLVGIEYADSEVFWEGTS